MVVPRAQAEVARAVELPEGYSIFWSGQYEYMQRARQRLMIIVPLTLALIFLILLHAGRGGGMGDMATQSQNPVGGLWMMWFQNDMKLMEGPLGGKRISEGE